MATNLLSDKTCKSAKATYKTKVLDGVEVVSDKLTSTTYDDGGGLALEVTPDGSKRWRFRYTFEGKRKLNSLGLYPQITLSNARILRDLAKVAIAKKINPFPAKEVIPVVIPIQDDWEDTFHKYKKLISTEDKTPSVLKRTTALQEHLLNKNSTFKQWSEYYLLKVIGDVTETHLVRTRKGFKADVYPFIGNIPMNDVKPKNIITILTTMTNRGAKESAKKVFSSVSRVYDVCIANFPDEVELNPTKSVSLKDVVGKTVKKHYPLITEAKELGTLLNSIDSYTGHTSIKLALKMIANVFVRPINIRLAEWTDINLKTKQWCIPAKKMKTRKELIVPLSEQVIEILKEAKKNSDNSIYLFPSPKSATTPLSDGALVGALRRLGYGSDEIVAHSFRGIFSTIAHEENEYVHDVIEIQLAHTVGSSVSQAYNRAEHLVQRTEMMQWYSDLLTIYQDAAK